MARSLGCWSGLAVGLLWAGTVLAEPSAADRATARSLAGEGYQALQGKDFATAADRFGRADALVHAPTLMIDWARSLAGLGKLVEAQERYEQIVREGVDAKAPKSWQRALNDATIELADLKPRLAWVTLSVRGSDQAHVSIDGAVVPPAAVGVRRAVNPGARLVRVQAKGCLPQKRELNLTEGAEAAAAFTLEPDPDAQIEPAVSPLLPLEAAPAPAPSSAPMYVAFGVAGAGLVVGGVAGALALAKRSSLSNQCHADGACPSSQTRVVSSYHTLGTVSGIGFAVGVAGAGAGLALWYFERSSNHPVQGFVVHPYVGLASLGAVGNF